MAFTPTQALIAFGSLRTQQVVDHLASAMHVDSFDFSNLYTRNAHAHVMPRAMGANNVRVHAGMEALALRVQHVVRL